VRGPHDHGHEADLTIGDPAVIVLEVPRRDDGRFAQVTTRASFGDGQCHDESFLTMVPATGLSESTFVHVGVFPEPGPVEL